MQSYYRQIRAMGTRLDMVFPGTGEEQGELVVALIDREVKRLEDMLSFFDPASELSRINAAEPGSPVTVSAEMKQILIMVQDYARKTGGYFDITSRPVSDWLKKNPGGETPPPDLIACTGMDKFEIEDHSLIRKAPGLILDPGGFGKGYALEKVKQILHKTKIPCAFISFGESSLYAHGHHPYGDFWIAGINDPIDGSSTGYTFALKDRALSVSGNSSSNRKKIGTFGHILNPVTRKMVTGTALVAVSSDSPLEAEILSTALFAAGKASADLTEHFPGAEIKWIYPDKTTDNEQ